MNIDSLQIKPYCYEEDQTHKKLFGFDECAYCRVPMCMFCKDIPAIGVFYNLQFGEKHPMCAYHKRTSNVKVNERLLYKEL